MEQYLWDKARIYSALAHPIRITMLEILERRSLDFGELRRDLEIKGPGNLQHHLQKLQGLIQQDSSGKYTLTSVGKEALASVKEEMEQTPWWWSCCCMKIVGPADRSWRIVNAAMGILLLALALYLVFPNVISLRTLAAAFITLWGIVFLVAALKRVRVSPGKPHL